MIVPLFFAIGAGLHWLVQRFEVTPLNSLLVDLRHHRDHRGGHPGRSGAPTFRRLESHYGQAKFKWGVLYLPVPELITLGAAVALSLAIWALLKHTDLGKALRAAAQDAPIAAAFGVNQKALALLLAGTCAALAAVAGVCLSLSFTLAPSQIYAWIGVVFAAVMMGGLGSALGAAGRRRRDRRQRGADDGGHRAVVGADRVVHAADRAAVAAAGPDVNHPRSGLTAASPSRGNTSGPAEPDPRCLLGEARGVARRSGPALGCAGSCVGRRAKQRWRN